MLILVESELLTNRGKHMALKDLVSDHKKLSEATIERIVKDYVRYDTKAGLIFFTPAGRQLNNEARILVYLVALEGWQFVSNDQLKIGTKPSDLESAVGIAGGTLRPILKKLKDSNLLISDKVNYSIQVGSLEFIEELVLRESSPGKSAHPSGKKRKGGGKISSDTKSTKPGPSKDLAGQFQDFLRSGFFKEPKAIGELVERYSEIGTVTKSSSVSGILLKAVRQGQLTRTRRERDGRKIWVYKEPKG